MPRSRPPIHPDVSWYLDLFKDRPLLTRPQERALGGRIKAGRYAHDACSDTPEQALLRADGAEAQRLLVEANLRLVVAAVKSFQPPGTPLDLDWVGAGNVGLLEAARRYDVDRGVKFATYATYWIRCELYEILRGATAPCHIPPYLLQRIRVWHALRRRMTTAGGEKPSFTAVAAAMGLKPAAAERLRHALRLRAAVRRPDSVEGLEGIADVRSPAPGAACVAADLAEVTRGCVARLPGPEAELLTLRYGLGGGVPRTLNEVGRQAGCTKENVRVRQLRAERHLGARADVRRLYEGAYAC